MKGKVLISEPFLQDPNFARSVVLIVEHGNEGTIGFVLNQPTDISINEVIEQLSLDNNLLQGGPVELDSFHYIHTYAHINGAVRINDDIYWSGDFEQVASGLQEGTIDANHFKFFVGYSGWAQGQLQAELNEKAWIIGDLSSGTLFDDKVSGADLWKHAIRARGDKDALLANSPTAPDLN